MGKFGDREWGKSAILVITSAWVHWYNTSRLMHRLGWRPPADVEAEYYGQQTTDQVVVHT